MGNDESKLRGKSSNPLTKATDSGNVYTNTSKQTIIPRSISEKIDEIVTITKSESKTQLSDPILDDLKAITPFTPLIKSNFTFEKHNLDSLDSTPLHEICRLYQKFLRKTTILIVKEQMLINNNIKTFESISAKCLSTTAMKFAETKKFEIKFRDINLLGKQLAKVSLMVEGIVESIQRLNLLLPFGERLEELKFSAVDTEEEIVHQHTCGADVKYPFSGCSAEKGSRSTMEDCHVNFDCMRTISPDIIIKSEGLPPHISFYGVYDGHGGIHAARFLSKHLHDSIFFSQHMEDSKFALAIKHGFIQTDVKILELSAKEGWRSGSTAAVALIINDHIYCGNVGDTETVLGRRIQSIDDSHPSFEPVLLSCKHKPNDPVERSRIEKAGGSVYFNRVCGSLAVSRAFGDADFKRPFNEAIGSFVIPEPSIISMELHSSNDEFLIIACDGLWDVMKYHEVIEYIALRKLNNVSPNQVAKELSQIAIRQRGSSDNVTLIIIYLK